MEKYSEFEYKKVLAILRELERHLDHDDKSHMDDSLERYMLVVNTYECRNDGEPLTISFSPGKNRDERINNFMNEFYLKNFLPILSAIFFTENGILLYEFTMFVGGCMCIRRCNDEQTQELFKVDPDVSSLALEDPSWEKVLGYFLERISNIINNNIAFR